MTERAFPWRTKPDIPRACSFNIAFIFILESRGPVLSLRHGGVAKDARKARGRKFTHYQHQTTGHGFGRLVDAGTGTYYTIGNGTKRTIWRKIRCTSYREGNRMVKRAARSLFPVGLRSFFSKRRTRGYTVWMWHALFMNTVPPGAELFTHIQCS